MHGMNFLDWVHMVFPEAKPDGRNELRVECPVCGPSESGSPNASINPSKQKWRCFKCSARGSGLKLVMHTERCNQKQAMELVDVRRQTISDEVDFDEIECELPDEAKALYCPKPGRIHRRAIAYAKERGWTKKKAKKFNLQVCVGGRYHGRIIIPIYDQTGKKLLGFQGRDFMDRRDDPKYLGPPAPGAVFNIHNQRNRDLILVHEGPADAIRTGGIAIQGVYLPRHRLDLIHALGKPVCVWLDNDAVDVAIDLAKRMSRYMETYVYTSHTAKDAAEATLEEVRSIRNRMTRIDRVSHLALKLQRTRQHMFGGL